MQPAVLAVASCRGHHLLQWENGAASLTPDLKIGIGK
jgi:hypothetical protein